MLQGGLFLFQTYQAAKTPENISIAYWNVRFALILVVLGVEWRKIKFPWLSKLNQNKIHENNTNFAFGDGFWGSGGVFLENKE